MARWPAKSNTIYGDTWEWDGTDWSQVSQDSAPARAYATMDFDSKTKRSILFGGTKISDTWAWDGNEWKQISDIGPSGRQQSNISFNSVANTLVLYGGIDAGTGNFLFRHLGMGRRVETEQQFRTQGSDRTRLWPSMEKTRC